MSTYSEILNTKVVNGVPADQQVLSQSIENQKQIKGQVEGIPNLLSLENDIIPAVPSTQSVGSEATPFNAVWSTLVSGTVLETGAGSVSYPSFQNSGNGLFFPSSSEMAVGVAGYRTVNFDSARTKFTGANNTQIVLESTAPGKEDLYSIGADSDGVNFSDPGNGYESIAKISTSAITSTVPVLSDTISLLTLADSGMRHDTVSAALAFQQNAVDQMSLKDGTVSILAGPLSVQDGSDLVPGIIFAGESQTGFFHEMGFVKMSFYGKEHVRFSADEFKLSAEGSGAETLLHSYLDSDVSGGFRTVKSRGTVESPTEVQSGDTLGFYSFDGQISQTKNETSQDSSTIRAVAQENFSNVGQGSYLSLDTTKIGDIESFPKMEIGKSGYPTVYSNGSIGGQKLTLAAVGSHQEINVEEFSILKVDTSLGDIILNTLAGGTDGQFLFVFKSDINNNLTINHNSLVSGQKIFTQNQANITLGTGYGGITLFCDEGEWKQIGIN